MIALTVLQAPPFATVQDLGRHGHRSQGVPPSGAMDPEALVLANLLVGNAPNAAAIEWVAGPGQFGVAADCLLAAGGRGHLVRCNGTIVPPWTSFRVRPGDDIRLEVPTQGRFGYLAVSGGLLVPPTLESRSTYLTGRFGGLEGRLLRPGDQLPVGMPTGATPRALPVEWQPGDASSIRVVQGPQAEFYDREAWDHLLGAAYTIAPASDRMGLRLAGPVLTHHGPDTLPSEPACPGAVQVPNGGTPIVLMPDGPTVGGYPKLAVVITADLGSLAQMPVGARPEFQLVSLEDAVAALRDQRRRWAAARAALSTPSNS